MRKIYLQRFWLRVLVLLAAFCLYFWYPDSFDVVESGKFFEHFSLLHILWLVWILDMLFKLKPIPGTLALGAAKQLKNYYHPASSCSSKDSLKTEMKRDDKRALLIAVIWLLLIVVLGWIYKKSWISEKGLMLIAIIFYVCDLFCVLFWCPFRVWFLKNRCCTTCRIFNWDHFMMVAPLACIKSFYSRSLVALAGFVLILWEYRLRKYPERFYEKANEALKCSNCTDLLCGRRKAASMGK